MKGSDLVAYREGGKWGFRDGRGAVVIPPTFDSAGSFSEGVARVRVGKLWGFIDPEGAFVIEPQFEQARHFSGGTAKVKGDGRWGMIDKKGYWVDQMDSQSYLDDRGRFVTKADHTGWEKPPRRNTDEKED